MKRLMLILMVCCATAGAQEVRRALPMSAEARPNDVARFLAGVPLPDGSELAALQQTPAYAEHVKALAKLTRHYDHHYFSKMRAWSAAELAPRLAMTRPVYYFFGGPDAVSALALFPEAPVYILGGLESVGSVAAPQTLTPEAVHEGLGNLRKSVNVILSYGHFITKDMKAELDRTAFRGVLPLLYTFIVLTGGEVVRSEYVGVRRDGSLVVTKGEAKGVLPGVKVTFRRAPGAAEQLIYYVQANVADDALKGSGGAVLAWAGSFGPGNVYLKAASYLMHESYFSRIRAFLLGKGMAVLQDDSGIPFRFFQDGNWRVWLFGRYTGTLDIFKEYHQADMAEVFAATGAAVELPFGTGYKWKVGESNLLLAVRQQAPRAEPVRGGGR
jgi:hypothetical protein